MSRKQRARKNELKLKTVEPEKFRLGNRKWVFVLITAVVFLVYANGLNNAFVSDDIPAILENVNRTNLSTNLTISPAGFAFVFIRHLTALVGGDNPLFYRLINVLFHAGSANLLLAILLPMLGFGGALAAALIFAIHPLLAEGVTWISGGPYAIGTFFGLLAMYFYLNSRSFRNDWKSWVAQIFSLSTFPIAVTIAPILTVYEATLGNLRKNWKRLVFFWLAGAWMTYIYISGNLTSRVTSIAVQNGGQVSNPNLPLQAVVAVYQYLRLFLWPDRLTLYHTELHFSPQQVTWFAVVSFLLFSLTVWGGKKEKRITFWILWFLLGISVTINPFGSNWIVAERYVYFASIGLIVVSILLYDRFIGRKLGKTGNTIVLTALLLCLGTRTIIRNTDWKNQDTLWIATAKYSPTSAQNHNNLGDLYARRKDFPKAIEEFQKALTINPRYADAYHNLGNTLLQIGNIEMGEQNYIKALEFNPLLWQSYAQLGAIYIYEGDRVKAEQILLKGISVTQNENLKGQLEKVRGL